MKQSREYLEEALTLMGDMSDSEKAKRLKIAQPTISQYRTGARKMDDFACIMVARVLGVDPMRIIAACQEEREKNEERREFWRDFRSTLGSTIVAALVLTSLTAMIPTPALAGTFDMAKEPMTNVYYVKYNTENWPPNPLFHVQTRSSKDCCNSDTLKICKMHRTLGRIT